MKNASIAINYAGRSNITRNNFINCWVMVWLSTEPIVDENYWSDYTTRYPNAKEVGNSGIWDTPYAYRENTVDNHPLIDPVIVPLTPTPIPTLTPNPSPTPSPSPIPSPTIEPTLEPTQTATPTSDDNQTLDLVPILVLSGAAVIVLVVGALVYFKRRKG